MWLGSLPGESCSFLIVSLSKRLSLYFMRSDQHVKYRMPRGFPVISSLILDYHIKQCILIHMSFVFICVWSCIPPWELTGKLQLHVNADQKLFQRLSKKSRDSVVPIVPTCLKNKDVYVFITRNTKNRISRCRCFVNADFHSKKFAKMYQI